MEHRAERKYFPLCSLWLKMFFRKEVEEFRIIRKISEIFRKNSPFPKKFRIYFFGKGRGLGQSQSNRCCWVKLPPSLPQLRRDKAGQIYANVLQ
jgi:hypothetical protein